MEALDGGLRRAIVRHFHKAKAFGAAGVTVGNEIDLVHSAIRLEELAEVMVGGGKRKIADKDIHGRSFASGKAWKRFARSFEQYAGAECSRNTQEEMARERQGHCQESPVFPTARHKSIR
jgi:hypothetical protein